MNVTLSICNVRAGGGDRVPRVIEALRTQAPDLIVLSEYRHGRRGDELRAGLTAMGLVHFEVPTVPHRQNTVLVASRYALRSLIPIPRDLTRHVLAVEVADLVLLGVYFPQLSAKVAVFDWLLALPKSVTERPALIAGDLNTGRNDLDREPHGVAFVAAEKMDRLESSGWTDAWRHFHGKTREYSWRSSKAGFRIDHVFASCPLVPHLRAARYDHTVREAGVTDHSMMVVELDPPRRK
jgi:exodeoxyribonuclease-3